MSDSLITILHNLQVVLTSHTNNRPFLHCTSFLILISFGIILVALIKSNLYLSYFGWTFFISSITHHLRDGIRRGLWIWPIGHTRPINLILYFTILFFFPFITSIFVNLNYKFLHKSFKQNVTFFVV